MRNLNYPSRGDIGEADVLMSTVKQVMVIDCQTAGISGDMILAALLDLMPSIEKVVEAMRSVKDYHEGCRTLEIRVDEVKRGGFRARRVETIAEESKLEKTGAELEDIVMACANGLNLSDEAKKFASTSIATLVEAEAKVHGETAQTAHLHEAGSVDTTAEIIGVAVASEELDLLKNTLIYSTPVAVGGGLFRFSHGTIQSPAPATLEILRSRRFSVTGGPVESELTTPTGAAILVNLAETVTKFYPPMRPTDVGYGAGAKDFAEMPNMLRIMLGQPVDYGLLTNEVYELETNLDDVTGEIVGHAVDRLMREGARDVCTVPMFTKKNRPGQIVKVIVDGENIENLSRILMEETGTLGLRVYPCRRHILARESVAVEISIEGVKELVNVKVARDSRGEIFQIKPEYEDLTRLAHKIGKPLRQIDELVRMKAREIFLERSS
jgi:hypothetical protein